MPHLNLHDRSAQNATAPVFMTIYQLEQLSLDDLYGLRLRVEHEQGFHPRNSIERLHLMGLLHNINHVIIEKLDQPIPLTQIERHFMLKS